MAQPLDIVRYDFGSVRWIHFVPMRQHSITAPATSDEEYQRQMEALLNYAAARTHLPLLDMR